MYKRLFIATTACLVAGGVFAQAYRWVDEDGVLHFSDRPAPGAEQFELPRDRPASGPSVPVPSSSFTRRNEPPPEEDPDEQPFSYESLTISSPAAEETLWNIEGVLSVTLDLQPSLQSGHRVRVYFDGEERMMANRTSFQIPEVYRGVHNIQVEVIDSSGALMIRSMPNRFYVQQNSIGP